MGRGELEGNESSKAEDLKEFHCVDGRVLGVGKLINIK